MPLLHDLMGLFRVRNGIAFLRHTLCAIAYKRFMIDFIKSIIPKIAESYYVTQNPVRRGSRPTAYTQRQVYPEQNFVAELFSQLRQVMPSNDGLRLNCNIYKEIRTLTYHDDHYESSISQILGSQAGVIPDLVYHRSQGDTNPQNQVFALECKIDPGLSEDEFNKDLIKLMIYRHQFNFQTVIFLIVNNRESQIMRLLDTYQRSYYLNQDRLHILVVERHSSPPVCLIHRDDNCT